MPAALPFVVLELRDVRLEAGADHRTRMGIGGSVQHEHRGPDGRERSGIHALLLEPEHVLPSLMMSARVAGFELLIGGGEFVGIQRQDQAAHGAKALVGIGELLWQAVHTPPQVVVRAFLDSRS